MSNNTRHILYSSRVRFSRLKIVSRIARKSPFLPRNTASRRSLPFWRRRRKDDFKRQRNGPGAEGRIPRLIFSPKRAARCEQGHARMIQNINIARFPHNSRVAERVTHARRRPKRPWRPRMSGISPDRGEWKRERRWKEEDAG